MLDNRTVDRELVPALTRALFLQRLERVGRGRGFGYEGLQDGVDDGIVPGGGGFVLVACGGREGGGAGGGGDLREAGGGDGLGLLRGGLAWGVCWMGLWLWDWR